MLARGFYPASQAGVAGEQETPAHWDGEDLAVEIPDGPRFWPGQERRACCLLTHVIGSFRRLLSLNAVQVRIGPVDQQLSRDRRRRRDSLVERVRRQQFEFSPGLDHIRFAAVVAQ